MIPVFLAEFLMYFLFGYLLRLVGAKFSWMLLIAAALFPLATIADTYLLGIDPTFTLVCHTIIAAYFFDGWLISTRPLSKGVFANV